MCVRSRVAIATLLSYTDLRNNTEARATRALERERTHTPTDNNKNNANNANNTSDNTNNANDANTNNAKGASEANGCWVAEGPTTPSIYTLHGIVRGSGITLHAESDGGSGERCRRARRSAHTCTRCPWNHAAPRARWHRPYVSSSGTASAGVLPTLGLLRGLAGGALLQELHDLRQFRAIVVLFLNNADSDLSQF